MRTTASWSSSSSSLNNVAQSKPTPTIKDHNEEVKFVPVSLIKSEIIPPSPNNSTPSTVDILLDFCGFSWVSYGISNLLIISQFPSPFQQQEEALKSPIFRQVVELSSDDQCENVVGALAWSPLSDGEISVALGNSICILSHQGSFCWRQSEVLVQSSKVEAIKWTGSGDGIVAVGTEVVLWKRKSRAWEIAWKFSVEQPQNLVSATWTAEGHVATAHYTNESSSSPLSRCVLVSQSDRRNGVVKTELRHPQPVSMIQWRPSSGIDTHRDVLLTCCLDGTVRLWSDIDNRSAKKSVRDFNDQRTVRPSFHVTAVIEINQSLKGSLGVDTFVTWASDIGGMFDTDGGVDTSFSSDASEFDTTVKCEWLIVFGAQMLLTYWAVHCLDDVSPLRFPRVTLWRRQELLGSQASSSSFQGSGISNYLIKAFISRSKLFGPPTVCSLFQLSSDNSMRWLQLDTSGSNENDGSLSLDGHAGNILQVAVHPCSSDVGIAASLDSNGVLLLWSLSSVSSSTLGIPTLVPPTWKILSKILVRNFSSTYSSLWWAPLALDEARVLLMSHNEGVDCFIVNIYERAEHNPSCHKLCTIPFTGHSRADGHVKIFANPMSSTSEKSLLSDSFMLFGVWMNPFLALSWKIVLHCDNSASNGGDLNELGEDISDSGTWRRASTFAGKKYGIVVDSCSSNMPDPHCHDRVTSFAIVSTVNLLPSDQLNFNFSCSSPAYHMATGCADGNVKLWRSISSKSSTLVPELKNLPWGLVGMFSTHQGPVHSLSSGASGQKIASISRVDQSENVSTLCIWEPVRTIGAGHFFLEDKISLDEIVVALNWLLVGDGQLLLGVCTKNQLRVFAQNKSHRQAFGKAGETLERNIWNCIARARIFPDANDFIWGPKATAVVVHDKYFSLFSKCLPVEKTLKNDQQKIDSACGTNGRNLLEVADKLSKSLPIYHPEALLLNLYTGNLKRAFVAVSHLVGYLSAVTNESGYNSSRLSHVVPQIPLSEYFEDSVSTSNASDKGLQWGMNTSFQSSSTQSIGGYSLDSNASSNLLGGTSRKSEITGFIESLEKIPEIAAIINMEKSEILAIIDLLGEVSDPSRSSAYASLDEPARRFWVPVRFQQLCFLRRLGRLPSMDELVIDSGLIAWAFHSDCQESLLNSVISNEPSWMDLRKLGAGFWFSDVAQLRSRMEKLARLQFLKKRDPKDSALLYIALNRVQVLAGLFKVSKDERDKPLVAFLSRNFQEEKHKAAALKNAYVLMGKHQLELATAFFLLGGDPISAISICAKTLGDEQLALVICRLLEGYGGALEQHLISKILLPDATEKGDYWLASILEWTSGNYSQCFLKFLDLQSDSLADQSILPSNGAAFLDPKVGQYCQMLTTKNSMKNFVGESSAALLSRWATLMTSTALNRCGLPLDALECLSSSSYISEDVYQGSNSDIEKPGILPGVLKTPSNDSSNWLSADVALNLESNIKLDMAVQYISKLMMEHPSWQSTVLTSSECETYKSELSVEKFQHNLNLILATFERKFLLNPADLINMILIYSCNDGLSFIGHCMLHNHISQQEPQIDSEGRFLLHPPLPQMFIKATEDVSHLYTLYIMRCSITSFPLNPSSSQLDRLSTCISSELHGWDTDMQRLLHPLRNLRKIMKLYSSSFGPENLKTFAPIDLLEYYVLFASAWLQRNLKYLILIVYPILVAYSDGHTPEIDVASLRKILRQRVEIMTRDSEKRVEDPERQILKHEQAGQAIFPLPEDERWKIIGACLWRLLAKFTNDQLKSIFNGVEDGNPPIGVSLSTSSRGSTESDGRNTSEQIKNVPLFLSRLVKRTVARVSSSHIKQLASLLRQKVQKGMPIPTVLWLEQPNQSAPGPLINHLNQGNDILQLLNKEDGASLIEILWQFSASPKEIREGLEQEKIWWLQSISQNSSKGWSDIDKGSGSEIENSETSKNDQEVSSNTANGTHGSQENLTLHDSRRKDSAPIKEVTKFLKPMEIYKKNGQLLEAMCINSIDRQQIAVASNRKGIIFLNSRDEQSRDLADYIWSESDWPKNGWAGTECTPVPTFVSPGIGLGSSEKGKHLGLGGATVGLGSLARPGRDMTGGGAFGIPGYAGMGASGLGWGTQQEFEEFADPPATVGNISSRALSSHPSRPLFLAGSSNTHIYLWEFGKERASATYGVLPAANVPPPYALASISSLKFDHYGHRFVTAAFDGTVCTWQLEVGGRSNICPTESSICFNNYASDVTYVAGSGSVIAAAGHSSTGANVVIWDTLAPPSTSQASLVCHEGGACSISVFDNDIGSGSISPIIVTGGKNGDIGLHDFRFIATGKARQRNSNVAESPTHHTRLVTSNQVGEHNNGMLWYIPKAHLGTITRVATIPHTSLFLTGSKDGDVKLWDAKRSELVFHWPKLHEKHTFLQPSSRGFGGVVQDAVTDIQVLPHGFLTCGGDGTVKLIQLKDMQYRT
ncbi:hypothetical protein C5167_047491 [Papaver somniferum]|uniref:RAVE complex protein Rav1 C-terminal domain-containing protein n=1 Tax=Papaver somniferum TaxID=3469 RepID=A0A4Y7LJ33_PAPSO|nr:uncharacterized protein LOC113323082 [Papaver somniferum]RZC84702.1 hypothetical protein C5167_047491 [Papaver somniferum]